MTITIDLPKGIEAELKKKAKRKGQDVDSFVRSLVEKDLSLPSWEDLVKPIQAQTKKLGLTESEIEELIDEELAEVRKITPLWSR